MPTYVVHTPAGLLDPGGQQELVTRVTASHQRHTGAPASFVQVIFHELPAGSHYIGGRPVRAPSVHVHGHIRTGRTAAAKDHLLRGLRDDVATVTGLAGEFVWVYLSEIEPQQMIEFGRVLPAPGGEAEWMRSLPDELRHRLESLDPTG